MEFDNDWADNIAGAIDSYYEGYSPYNNSEKNVEYCPNGHVGRGILIDSEINDGYVDRLKFECELCGEVWWEDDSNDEDEE